MRNVCSLPIALALLFNFTACSKKAEQSLNAAMADAANAAGAGGATGSTGGGLQSGSSPTITGANAGGVTPIAGTGATASAANHAPTTVAQALAALNSPPPGASVTPSGSWAVSRTRGVTVTVTQEDPRAPVNREETRPRFTGNDLITSNPQYDEVPVIMTKECSAELRELKIRIRKGSWVKVGPDHYRAEIFNGEQVVELPLGTTKIVGTVEFKELPIEALGNMKVKRLFRVNLASQQIRVEPTRLQNNRAEQEPTPPLNVRSGQIEFTSTAGAIRTWHAYYRLDLAPSRGFRFSDAYISDRNPVDYVTMSTLNLRGEFVARSYCTIGRGENFVPSGFYFSRLTIKATLDEDQFVDLRSLIYKVRGGTTLDATESFNASEGRFLCPSQIETVPVGSGEMREQLVALQAGVYPMFDAGNYRMDNRCWPDGSINIDYPLTLLGNGNNPSQTYTQIRGFGNWTGRIAVSGGVRTEPFTFDGSRLKVSSLNLSNYFSGSYQGTLYRLDSPQPFVMANPAFTLTSFAQDRERRKSFPAAQPVETRAHEFLYRWRDQDGYLTTIVEYRPNLRWINYLSDEAFFNQPTKVWSSLPSSQEPRPGRFCVVTMVMNFRDMPMLLMNFGLNNSWNDASSLNGSGPQAAASQRRLAQRYCSDNTSTLVNRLREEHPTLGF